MAHSFHVGRHKHYKWSRDIPPVLTVASGSELDLDLEDGGDGQIRPDNLATCVQDFDFSRADPGHGPIFVEGAEPGDVLKVEFLELRTADHGWTAIFPGFGILADEFDALGPQVRLWDLSRARELGHLEFLKETPGGRWAAGDVVARIPYHPFLGTVGVAPAEGEWPMVPPLPTGGNIDTRHAGVGSVLYLPVRVPGALLSMGDGHAAQGDGEVCGTAVETPMRGRIRVSVEKASQRQGWGLESPWILTAPRETRPELNIGKGGDGSGDSGREFMCLGIASDMREATRQAVRGVVTWLVAEKGLTKVEAYMLSSVAGSLKITQCVDMPNYTVGFGIPLGIFA